MVHGVEGRAQVKVTAIQTGTVNLHRLHEEAPLQWNPLRRKVRLADMSIDPARDVRQLLMTHLHHDHTGGLHHFPHTQISSILLLGHDPGISERLANRQVLFGEEATLGASPRSQG